MPIQAPQHDCQTELRKADLRVTQARLGVLAALEQADMPLAVNELQSYLKAHHVKADKTTVFRIINSFTKKGLAIPVQLNEGRLRYEPAARGDHHHFVCERCGKIADISDCSIQSLTDEIKTKKGFLVKRHSLEFFGLCKDCQR